MPTPPRRPTPAVYRRRRLMVGGTVLLLAIAVVDIVRGDDQPPPARETAGQVAGSPTPSAGPSSDTTGSGEGRTKRRQRRAEVVTPPPAPDPPDPVGDCADFDVVATPVMASAVAGRPVLITLSLRTEEAEACTWQVGSEHLAYRVTDADGGDVWSSSQCPRDVPGDAVVVRRDFPTTYRLAWSGRASSVDCPEMEHVAPGEYAVQAAAIGGPASEVVPFTLDAAPEETRPSEPLGPEVPGAGRDRAGRDGTEQRRQDRKKRDRAQT